MKDVKLYNGRAHSKAYIPNSNSFVGVRLRNEKEVKLKAISTEFIGNKPDSIFLYKYPFNKPIAVYSVGGDVWKEVLHDNELSEGDYYLGYFQKDGATALKMDLDWEDPPCDCDNTWSSFYNAYKDNVSVVGFEIESKEVYPGIDYDKVLLNRISNYGLNIRFLV